MKYLVTNDIIGSIEVNVKTGNITPTDGCKLKNMTLQLYHHIYDRYQDVLDEGVSEEVEVLKLLLKRKSPKEVTREMNLSLERIEQVMNS